MILSKHLINNLTLNKKELKNFASNFFQEELSSSVAAKIIFFYGDLGSGKTFFIQSCLEKFNLKITSPTFTILNSYSVILQNIEKKIFHIDLYRLEKIYSLNELFDFDSYLENAIIFIEWAEKLIQIEKKIDFSIYLNKDNSIDTREISIIKH